MKNRYFTLSLIPALAAVGLMMLFLALGFWQLARAEQKKALVLAFEQHANAPALNFTANIAENAEKYRYYQLKAMGYFDNAHTLLLDNKVYRGRVGYEILTPFVPEGETHAFLVNRGWAPLGATRNILPHIPPVVGKQTITGLITVPSAKPFKLGNPVDNPGQWPLRIEQIEIAQVQKWVSLPLYPMVILLSSKLTPGFICDWPIVMPVQVDRHLAYAFQWFLLAFIVFVVLGVLSYRYRIK